MRMWNRARVGLIGLAVAGFIGGVAASAAAQAPQQAPADQKPAYTLAEYNAYKQAADEPNAGQRIKDLDDFVSKFLNVRASPLRLPHLLSGVQRTEELSEGD